jgi:hypothetical protein
MSNTDRLRSWLDLPMSDRLVDIGPIEQQAPSTSSYQSLDIPCQWIRSDTRRCTQQGAAFRVLKIDSPTTLAPPTLKFKRVATSVVRTDQINYRLQKPPPYGRRATPRPTERPDVHVRRQHPPNPGPIKPRRVPPTHAIRYDPTSKPHYKPTYLHILLRIHHDQHVFNL